ncbi:MAG: ParB/RepB/Spo0J family partition protein [Bacilli bacterium]
METKRKALGKGLEQLFSSEALDIDQLEKEIVGNASQEEIVNIRIDMLRSNPYQPRKKFDESALMELRDSIIEHGVFQPIIIKKTIKGYEIIAGERRVKASKMAGLETIPAIIRDFTDEQMMEIALLENLQRENLNAIEEAKAYENLINKLDITQDALAKKIGKSRSHITNILGLLRLPKEVQEMVLYNKISMGHARVLSKIEDEEQVISLANNVINNRLSVRELEDKSNNNVFKRKVAIVKRKTNRPNEYKYIEEALEEKLGTKVKIKENKIEISFVSINDLNRIIEIINANI